jgi:hypothetical protein
MLKTQIPNGSPRPPLLPDAQPLSNIEYMLFGKGEDTYPAHFITRPTDFDQIIRVKIDHDLPDEQLPGGLQLTVPKRANTLDDRIKEGAGTIPLVPARQSVCPGLWVTISPSSSSAASSALPNRIASGAGAAEGGFADPCRPFRVLI